MGSLVQLARGLLAMQGHQHLVCGNKFSAAACTSLAPIMGQALSATALHHRCKVQGCVCSHPDGLKRVVPLLQICPEDALHFK